jgi:hypothetical protein
MTANEMADALELKLDRSDSFGSPGYEDFELSSVLSEANSLYVKKYFDELNNRKGKGFQETEIRDQGLGALIKDAPSLVSSASQVGVIVNTDVVGKFFDLPLDHMYTIYEECTIDKTTCGTTSNIVAYVVPISHTEMQRFSWSKYKKPFYRISGDSRVWRSEFSRQITGINPAIAATAKRHEMFTDGSFNINAYHMRYVKNPENIVVDRDTPTNQRNCELDTSTHIVIVDIAMSLMSDRIREQRMQNIEQFKELE